MEHSLWKLMHKLAEGRDHLPAFLYRENGETVSVDYDAFLRELERSAARAAKLPERRIGVWGRNSYSWILAAYGCMLAGKHVILFDSAVARQDFEQLADYADVEAFAADAELADEAREIFPDRAVYRFDEFRGEAESGEVCEPPRSPEQDIIIFTSGTSTSAKGVVIPMESLTEHLRLFRDALPGNPKEVYFSPIPYHHIFGFLMVIEVLNRSGTFCISSGARELKNDLWAFCADNVSLVPSMIQFVLASCGFPPQTRAVITGGSACPKECQGALRAQGIELYAMYGMSEVLGLAAISEAGGELLRYRVVEGLRAQLSEQGELWLTLPCHFKEYYKKEAETREILRGDTVMTGDMAELDAQGYLRILGRLGDMIVLRNGEKLNAADMDVELVKLPGLREAAVFGSDGSPVLAYTPGDEFDEERFRVALNAYNRGRPVDRKVARTWNYGAPLPRTALGKIRRNQLCAEYACQNQAR